MRVWDLVWGKPVEVLASVGLGILAYVRWFPGVIAVSSFILLHALVSWGRERSLTKRLGNNYMDVLRRSLHLVSDLADLTAKSFDIWMVDLYLPRFVWGRRRRWPYVGGKVLSRELSIALGNASTAPAEIEMDHEYFGACFKGAKNGLWADPMLVGPIDSGVENRFSDLPEKTNAELRRAFGVVMTYPLVDGLGRDCRGILVVHAARESEVATKVMGALIEREGMRRLDGCRHDIHSLIG